MEEKCEKKGYRDLYRPREKINGEEEDGEDEKIGIEKGEKEGYRYSRGVRGKLNEEDGEDENIGIEKGEKIGGEDGEDEKIGIEKDGLGDEEPQSNDENADEQIEFIERTEDDGNIFEQDPASIFDDDDDVKVEIIPQDLNDEEESIIPNIDSNEPKTMVNQGGDDIFDEGFVDSEMDADIFLKEGNPESWNDFIDGLSDEDLENEVEGVVDQAIEEDKKTPKKQRKERLRYERELRAKRVLEDKELALKILQEEIELATYWVAGIGEDD
jgi:hypothetical protein